jgi:hypothetical protein
VSDNVVERDARGRFLPGSTANPGGTPGRVAELRRLLDPHMPELVERVRKAAMEGDMTAAKLLLDRLIPVLKPETAASAVPGLAQGTVAEKVQVVLENVADGSLSPSIAAELLAAVATATSLATMEELRREIAALKGPDYANAV